MTNKQQNLCSTRWGRVRRIGQFHPVVVALAAVAVGTSLAIASSGTLGAFSVAQDLSSSGDFSSVEIRMERLSDKVHFLAPDPGVGGNMLVSVGDDGILLVDTDYMQLSEKIKAAIAQIQRGKVDFMVNTHYHYDHASGNAAFGLESVIVAHESIRRRLMEGREAGSNFRVTPTPVEALPVLTFEDSVTFHWNGEQIDVTHTSNPSHTDGDTVIFFRDANAIHTGDQYVNLNGFPYIDHDVGGSALGLRDNIAEILGMIDGQTKVIPGHGPIATKAELQFYHDQVAESIEFIEDARDSGKSLEAIQADGLPAKFSGYDGFQSESAWIQYVYASLENSV